MVRRVAVIGAGAAGLAVLRRFTARKEDFEVVCFEQLSNVGGLWNYCDNIDDPNHPTGSQYTAVYKHMKPLFPKELMVFDGLSYPDELPSFISHVDVRKYLERFADEFHLRDVIESNKKVLKVDPKMVRGKEDAWMVRIEDVHTKVQEELEFDIVVVCNGKYSVPYYPQIKEMDVFKGQMIHSQRYRDPEEFRGKRVLVVGGGLSGIDISIEISAFAEKTWLSHLRDNKLPLSNGICQVGRVMQLTSDSAVVSRVFNDAERGFNDFSKHQLKQIQNWLENHQLNCLLNEFDYNELQSPDEDNPTESYKIGPIDVIMFCTGFYLSYPFLSADCGLAVKSHINVGPLYKDLICLNRPTLALVGVFNLVVNFTSFDCQAQFLLAFYEGRISFPSSEEKMEEELTKYNALKVAHGVDVNKSPFKIYDFQWIYFRHLASIGKFDPPPSYLEDLFKKVDKTRSDDFMNYKKIKYKKGADGFYIRA